MKRTLSTLAFLFVVILLFVGAYLSWLHRDDSTRATEEARQAQMMEDQAREKAEKIGR